MSKQDPQIRFSLTLTLSKEDEIEGKALTQNPVAAIVPFSACFDQEGTADELRCPDMS